MRSFLRSLLVFGVLFGVSIASGQLKTLWTKSAAGATVPAWFSTTDNNTRALAAHGSKVYVASRTGATHIYVLDAATGDSLGELNTTGLSGGTYVISDVEVSSDGVIFVCNLTLNAPTSAFKVYKWTSDTATPTAVITYTGANSRIGDKMTVVGSTADNSVLIYAAVASKDTVLKFSTADTAVTFTPSVIKVSSPTSLGSSPSVAPVAGGSAAFYVNGIGINPKHYSSDGTLLATIPGEILATGSNAIRYFEAASRKFVVSFQGASVASARIVDVTAGDTTGAAATNVVTPLLGSNANSNGTGDVEVIAYGTDSVDVFVLGTNNGLAAFRTNLKQNDITFQVDLEVKIKEGAFNPATDSIVVRGDFNGWSGNAALLTDANNDSIYTGTYNVGAGSSITFKYVRHTASADAWEGDPNRTFNLTGNPQTIAVDYFDRDSKVSLPFNATFKVNMDVKFQEGTFKPDSHQVVVRGSFNGWGGNAQALTDANNDKVYEGTFSLLGSTGDLFDYKFVLVKPSGDTWEDNIGANRRFKYEGTDVVLSTVWFDNDSLVSMPVSGNLLFTVDMSVFEELGYFQRAQNDTMLIRGSFNGWGSTGESIMTRIAGTEQYELIVPYSGFSYDKFAYKFFMDLNDSADNIDTRFPGYLANESSRDGIRYDHPGELGDGNRQYVLPPGGGNIEAPIQYFSDINPGGVIPQSTSVTVTFQVDMRPARAWADAFVPGTDSVFICLFDALWRVKQGFSISTAPELAMSDANNDTIYTASLTVNGPAYYNIMYFTRYRHPGVGGTQVDEGGGLGVQKPYRSRYIQPTGYRTFPTNYTFPVDTWKKDPPLETESAPFPATDVIRLDEVLPVSYELGQNYPNPFNPTTTINFSLAKDSHVSLKIFNILGQEVLTVLNDLQKAGSYKVTLDASSMPSGVYFYRLEAGSFVDVKKMTLLK